jgi:tetratricopeptide (TPR) repeat protein
VVDLAMGRQARAAAVEAEERAAGPVAATPRADALRAEAARLAQRAMEEADFSAPVAFRGEPEALLVLGLDLGRLGWPREAARALASLVRRFPDSPLAPDAWLALGEHHLVEDDLTRARAAFEVASRAGRAEVRGWSEARLAEVALRVHDPEGALAAVARALDAGSARALAILDRLAEAPEQLSGAARGRLTETVERVGGVHEPTAILGSSSPARGGRAGERGANPEIPPLCTSAAPPWAPADAPPVAVRLGAWAGSADALHAMGLARLAAGHPLEARVLLERAARAAPGDPALANDLAVARAARGDVAGARSALDVAVARGPALGPAQENLAAVALAQGDAARAEEAATEAVILEPGRWQGRLLRARALAALGREHEALGEAGRVLDLAPGQADALQLATSLGERRRPAARSPSDDTRPGP